MSFEAVKNSYFLAIIVQIGPQKCATVYSLYLFYANKSKQNHWILFGLLI